MAPVTNFRSWPDMVERGWGTMRKTGTRWDFVPRLDEMVTVPGITGKVNIHVAPLVVHLKGWLEVHRGRSLDTVGNWALSVRPIRGREAEAYAGVIDAWSIHSCGGAVDFEAPRNPLGALGRGDFPDGWLQECHRWGFAWGAGTPHGDYVGRADRMHIEFVGTREQADEYVATLAGTDADQEDDVSAAEVWNTPVKNLYDPSQPDMPAHAALEWSMARSAQAARDAAAALDSSKRVEAKLDQLLARK